MDANFHKTAKQTVAFLGDLVKQFSGQRIAITGACGFLGSQFIHLFLMMNEQLEHPCQVIAYDNLMRGKPTWLESLHKRQDFKFIERDIVEHGQYDNCDYIIHAASIASPIFYRQFPIETMDANVKGIRNILDYAKTKSLKGILYLSSSEVYGDPPDDQIPTPESFGGHVSSTGPRACYDESKRYGETLCVNYMRQFGVPVRIVRPFNVYGVGLHPEDGRVISDFFRDLIATNTIKLLSDGKSTRTFCYISDAMNGFIRALLLGEDGAVYNIGNNSPEINMTQLANKILALSDAAGEIVYQLSPDPDYLVDNPSRRCPDISKAASQLGYRPQVSLDQGLEMTYNYYKSNL